MNDAKAGADIFSQWMHDTVAMVLCATGDFESQDRVPGICKDIRNSVRGNRSLSSNLTRADAVLLTHATLRWSVRTLGVDVAEGTR